MGLLIPAELGGRDADLETYSEVVVELAKGCGSTALIFALHCGATRALAGTDCERARSVMKKVIDSGHVIAWGFSEPGIGGNVMAPQLTATVTEQDSLQVRGAKAFCTGAGFVDHYLINASSGEPEFRHSQTMLLLDAQQAGIRVDHVWDAMGMRANQANTVYFDVLANSEDALDGLGGGMAILAHALPALMLGLAAASIGVGEAAHEFAVGHVARRRHVDKGHSLAGYATVRAQIAESVVALHGARLALSHAARAAGRDPLETIPAMNLAKYMANTAAIRSADVSMEVCGGTGFLRGTPLERHYRDARAGAAMGANLGALRDMIGRAAVGLDVRGTGTD
jgi:alkylation response protein AidB-like acyl-CoA dehydrogenase